LHRVILSTSNPGDVVLDPFFGTGTTGAVAKKLGRNFIGFEMEEDYIIHAQKRIDKIDQGTGMAISVTPSKRNAVRVPFGNLIERGLINPGTILMFLQRLDVLALYDATRPDTNRRATLHCSPAIGRNG